MLSPPLDEPGEGDEDDDVSEAGVDDGVDGSLVLFSVLVGAVAGDALLVDRLSVL